MDEQPVNRLDLIFLIQAYNRGELSLDEFIEQSKAWAEAMLQRQEAADLYITPDH
jgi:hypothetical protein